MLFVAVLHKVQEKKREILVSKHRWQKQRVKTIAQGNSRFCLEGLHTGDAMMIIFLNPVVCPKQNI